MKRLFALLMTLCLMVTLFSGCGEDQPLSGGNDSQQEGGSNEEETIEVTIDETIVYDVDGIKVTVTGLDEDAFTGPELKILVENETDRNIAFSVDTFDVNGITVSCFAYVDVAAGKKANGTISFMETAMEVSGIEHFAVLNALDAYIVDCDTYETIDTFTFEVETSVAAEYVQEIDESGDVLYQENGITVIAKTLSEGILGYEVVLLVKNETGREVVVNAENISVNGFTIDAWLYDLIAADSVRFCVMDLLSTSLEENGIESVEEITFTVSIIDAENYDLICESEELSVSAAE